MGRKVSGKIGVKANYVSGYDVCGICQNKMPVSIKLIPSIINRELKPV
ncbi:MAG: hypothetical protein QMD08_04030 [Actinomycetota bacterium]|nr:hypothetical protein [Actinomycetota bacterium]